MATVKSTAGSTNSAAMPGLAADQDQAGAERDRPEHVGVEHRAASSRSPIGDDAGRVEGLQDARPR